HTPHTHHTHTHTHTHTHSHTHTHTHTHPPITESHTECLFHTIDLESTRLSSELTHTTHTPHTHTHTHTHTLSHTHTHKHTPPHHRVSHRVLFFYRREVVSDGLSHTTALRALKCLAMLTVLFLYLLLFATVI